MVFPDYYNAPRTDQGNVRIFSGSEVYSRDGDLVNPQFSHKLADSLVVFTEPQQTAPCNCGSHDNVDAFQFRDVLIKPAEMYDIVLQAGILKTVKGSQLFPNHDNPNSVRFRVEGSSTEIVFLVKPANIVNGTLNEAVKITPLEEKKKRTPHDSSKCKKCLLRKEKEGETAKPKQVEEAIKEAIKENSEPAEKFKFSFNNIEVFKGVNYNAMLSDAHTEVMQGNDLFQNVDGDEDYIYALKNNLWAKVYSITRIEVGSMDGVQSIKKAENTPIIAAPKEIIIAPVVAKPENKVPCQVITKSSNPHDSPEKYHFLTWSQGKRTCFCRSHRLAQQEEENTNSAPLTSEHSSVCTQSNLADTGRAVPTLLMSGIPKGVKAFPFFTLIETDGTIKKAFSDLYKDKRPMVIVPKDMMNSPAKSSESPVVIIGTISIYEDKFYQVELSNKTCIVAPGKHFKARANKVQQFSVKVNDQRIKVPEDAKITEITFKFDSQKDQTADLPIPTDSDLEDLPEDAVIPKGWNGVAVIQNNQVRIPRSRIRQSKSRPGYLLVKHEEKIFLVPQKCVKMQKTY